MYHYTYEITYTNNLKYIRVRSCKCKPSEDTAYIGSSKVTPNDKILMKLILKLHTTREEALQHEIYLHNYNDVAVNPLYYNKAKQTSTGFDTTGTVPIFTEEHKSKISNGLKQFTPTKEQQLHKSEAIRKALTGKSREPRTQEFKDLMSAKLSGKPTWSSGKKFSVETTKELYSTRCKYPNKYTWVNTKTGEIRVATAQEMGLSYGKKITSRFNKVISKVNNSCLGWKLQ